MSLVLLGVLLLLTRTGCLSAWNPVCEVRWTKTNAAQNLNCSVHGGLVASRITWKRHDYVIRERTGPVTWLGLALGETVLDGAGKLLCEVVIGTQKKSCRIALPEPPDITSRQSIYEVYIGTRLVVPCEAKGRPKPRITWTRRDLTLAKKPMPHSIKQIKSRGSLDLVIEKTSMVHSGIYTCQATNAVGEDTHFVLITILYNIIAHLPSVVPVKRTLTSKKGSRVVLECTAVHTPRRYTALYWDHHGTRITSTARRYIEARFSVKIIKKFYKIEKVAMSLVIRHVHARDMGRYTCGVVTHIGSHEDHVELIVQE